MEYTIEFYKEDGKWCAYIGQEDGSGYKVRENTKVECINKVALYFNANADWEE